MILFSIVVDPPSKGCGRVMLRVKVTERKSGELLHRWSRP